MVNNILIVDDEEGRHSVLAKRMAGNNIDHAYNYADAVRFLSTNRRYDIVYLDHDLKDFEVLEDQPTLIEWTGHHVAKFMVNMEADARPFTVVVHSWNPAGAANIVSELRRCPDIKVIKQPFKLL